MMMVLVLFCLPRQVTAVELRGTCGKGLNNNSTASVQRQINASDTWNVWLANRKKI